MPSISIDGTDVQEITIDGDVVTEITMDGDIVYNPDPDQGGTQSFSINYDGPGMDVTSLTSMGWETQGVVYSPDTGQWYVSEVTDSSTPSTIHEFNADGTTTGNTFQFDSASPNPNHANALSWHDNHLWCSEYNTNKVYKIDWSARSVVGSFDLGNGVVDDDSLGPITFIPTSTGGHKLLAGMWGSTNSNAYLVNYDQAITDGTASGNIYLTLSDNIDTGRTQGIFYYDGALYINSDAMPNSTSNASGWGSYPTIKVGFPYADNLAAGDPLIAGRYKWWWPNAEISYDDPIQDIGYDSGTDTFWMASESSQTIYDGAAADTVATLPNEWDDWNLAAFSGPNGEWDNSIHVDHTVASGKRDQHVFYQRQPVRVEVWYYDDLADQDGTDAGKKVYVSVAEPNNTYNDTEHALAVNDSQSSTEYVAWNATDGWHTTGVSRPSSEQWVKFRWDMDGSWTDTYISKDGGSSWTAVNSYDYSATALGTLQLQTSSSDGGQAYIGPFTVTPQ